VFIDLKIISSRDTITELILSGQLNGSITRSREEAMQSKADTVATMRELECAHDGWRPVSTGYLKRYIALAVLDQSWRPVSQALNTSKAINKTIDMVERDLDYVRAAA